MRTHELNIAIGAGARCDKLREAVELLKTMRENGDSECTPDIGSYDAILQPLASAGRYDTLLELIDQMFADGTLSCAHQLTALSRPHPLRRPTTYITPQPSPFILPCLSCEAPVLATGFKG